MATSRSCGLLPDLPTARVPTVRASGWQHEADIILVVPAYERASERRRALLIAVLLAMASPLARADQESSAHQPVTIANTERRTLKSASNGVEYEIDVALPRGYAASQKHYPAVYTLDGNVFFPLLTGSYRMAARLIPDELIIIGVGYPTDDYGFWSQEYGASRARDYTTRPLKAPGGSSAGAGGAPAFLRFLRTELIPFIDSSYRTFPGDRGLMGHSYGGLFCAYALTHEPGLFQKYAIGSPALWWDNEAALRWESEYAARHSELPARVYFYVGAFEDDNIMTAPTRRFWEALKARHYIGLDLVDFATVPGEIHQSVSLGSMEHALRSLYAPRPASLSLESLRRYVGDWKAEGGPSWTIRLDGKRLFIDIPGFSFDDAQRAPESHELLAKSDTSLFTELADTFVFTLNSARNMAMEMKVTMPRVGYAAVLRRASAKSGGGAPR